jgi:hypothetical protein
VRFGVEASHVHDHGYELTGCRRPKPGPRRRSAPLPRLRPPVRGSRRKPANANIRRRRRPCQSWSWSSGRRAAAQRSYAVSVMALLGVFEGMLNGSRCLEVLVRQVPDLAEHRVVGALALSSVEEFALARRVPPDEVLLHQDAGRHRHDPGLPRSSGSPAERAAVPKSVRGRARRQRPRLSDSTTAAATPGVARWFPTLSTGTPQPSPVPRVPDPSTPSTEARATPGRASGRGRRDSAPLSTRATRPPCAGGGVQTRGWHALLRRCQGDARGTRGRHAATCLTSGKTTRQRRPASRVHSPRGPSATIQPSLRCAGPPAGQTRRCSPDTPRIGGVPPWVRARYGLVDDTARAASGMHAELRFRALP